MKPYRTRSAAAIDAKCGPPICRERDNALTGRSRLPGGDPRKASQRNSRRLAQRSPR